MSPTETAATSLDRRQEAGPAVRAFTRLLRAHSSTTRLLSAELLEEHGLTINDYEALLVLSRADGHRLKRVDISRQLLLTPSGITRLLEGLEAEGLVERESCPSDLRVTYAHLTETGSRTAAGCFLRPRRLDHGAVRSAPRRDRDRGTGRRAGQAPRRRRYRRRVQPRLRPHRAEAIRGAHRHRIRSARREPRRSRRVVVMLDR